MEILDLLKKKRPLYAERINTAWVAATGCDFVNDNITAVNLVMFTDYFKDQVSENSARTYLAYVKSCINTLKADGKLKQLPPAWERSAKVKAEQVAMCYLTEEEVERLVDYTPKNDYERKVRAQFLVECYTGARSSDVVRLTKENIDAQGNITYISQKTKIRTIVPCKPLVREIIEDGDNKENPRSAIPLKTKNEIIRRMLKAVGVNDVVKVFKGGEELTGEKYTFCSTHTGRRTFCTNLYLRGVDLYTISRLAGHSSVTITEHYVVCGIRALSKQAMEYFK